LGKVEKWKDRSHEHGIELVKKLAKDAEVEDQTE
jgi:uncharacterized protein YegP (UPF0339 family)